MYTHSHSKNLSQVRGFEDIRTAKKLIGKYTSSQPGSNRVFFWKIFVVLGKAEGRGQKGEAEGRRYKTVKD
jgi:hypothetical protein